MSAEIQYLLLESYVPSLGVQTPHALYVLALDALARGALQQLYEYCGEPRNAWLYSTSVKDQFGAWYTYPDAISGTVLLPGKPPGYAFPHVMLCTAPEILAVQLLNPSSMSLLPPADRLLIGYPGQDTLSFIQYATGTRHSAESVPWALLGFPEAVGRGHER